MRIVLDMNIPEVWEGFLNKAGHEALHWSKVGDICANDAEIMEWARTHDYVVFTHDLDFGALLFATHANAPSVVQLRVQHVIPEVVGDAVLEALTISADSLESGALVTIDPGRHRLRVLPLRRND